ncbi:MAG TPA: DeoR/GlpR family DNA-binding transcription regulator [Spirochaetia bacterium]
MKERIDRILEILSRTGYRSVAELSADLGVSEMTIRRYLDRLEERQLVKRTHGGAWTGQEMIEVDYRIRETVHRGQKEAIGRAAWSLVEPGESIFIDAGSTNAYLALAIDGSRRVTVVTASTVVAQALEGKPNVETILLGGKVHGPSHSLVGPIPEEMIDRFRFTKAFLGTVGISLTDGFTQSNLDEVPVKKKVAASARQVIVLADSSKFDREVLVLFLRLDQVQTVITDSGIAADRRAALEERGLRVIVADATQHEANRGGFR